MQAEIKQYLDHISMVCPLMKPEDLAEFATALLVTKLKKGDYYLKAGRIQEHGGYLLSGLLRAYHLDEEGVERNIYFIPENDYCFHYASFMAKKPSPLHFHCLEPCVVVNFPRNYLRQSYDRFPAFERYGRLIVEGKLKRQQERLESLLYHSAEKRYIDFKTSNEDLFRRISISHLSSFLGVERQTLTRIRKKLRQKAS